MSLSLQVLIGFCPGTVANSLLSKPGVVLVYRREEKEMKRPASYL